MGIQKYFPIYPLTTIVPQSFLNKPYLNKYKFHFVVPRSHDQSMMTVMMPTKKMNKMVVKMMMLMMMKLQRTDKTFFQLKSPRDWNLRWWLLNPQWNQTSFWTTKRRTGGVPPKEMSSSNRLIFRWYVDFCLGVYTRPETNSLHLKTDGWKLMSCWEGVFSGNMLVSGSLSI